MNLGSERKRISKEKTRRTNSNRYKRKRGGRQGGDPLSQSTTMELSVSRMLESEGKNL